MTGYGTEFRVRAALFVALLGLTLGLHPAAAQVEAPDGRILQQSEVIIVGTVQEIHAVAAADIEATGNTAVVRIENMIKPGDWSPIRTFEGRAATVQLRDPEALPVGAVATFYTRLWTLGKGLALIELAHTLVDVQETKREGAIGNAADSAIQMLQAEADRELKARIERADVVLAGRVQSVREPVTDNEKGAPQRMSEHDPQWREAVIEVRQVVKGPDMESTSQIAVRFSGSKDVMWASSPKFEVGQEGIFILMAEDILPVSQPTQNVKLVGRIIDPANYLPTNEEKRLQDLLKQ